MLGRIKKEAPMERKFEEYECAESEVLVRTFNAIRRKIMSRMLVND
jgi:hypothetical protein